MSNYKNKILHSIIWPAGTAKVGCKESNNDFQYVEEGSIHTVLLSSFKSKTFLETFWELLTAVSFLL